jgi:predicted O-linked N-acetylglucosamine transferase (SPINDLY family)
MTPDLSKAIALHRRGDLEAAGALYEAALSQAPRDTQTLYLIGLCRFDMGDLDAGARHMQHLLKIKPRHAAAHHALGKALAAGGKVRRAEDQFRTALKLDPGLTDSRIELAALAVTAGRLDGAERLLGEAIERDPNDARLHTNLGDVLRRRGRGADALAAWTRALAIDPDRAEPRCNVALHLANHGRAAEAVDQLNDAIARTPDVADLHYTLGALEFYRSRYRQAVAALEEALRLRPGYRRAEVRLAQTCQNLCEWDRQADLMPAVDEEIGSALAGGNCVVTPFFSLALPIAEESRLAVAGAAARLIEASARQVRGELKFRDRRGARPRLHIGYLSSDWRDHPVGHVMYGAFERHDRSAFEITALSTGPDDGSDVLRRIRDGCDRFVDLVPQDDRTAAQTIHGLGIDILVGLQGFTGISRLGVTALRPAPVHALYMAFSGTMAAPWVDYVIADRIILPSASRRHYTEAPVYMPECFFIGNDAVPISDTVPPRESEGLPEDGVVYCSFSNGFKITREIFALWMRILHRVPGSVLWLLGGEAGMERNLRRAADDSGAGAARLVFAQRVPKADHLARLRHGDLFLDTPVYGSHVSALDALWAGLPMLTRSGDGFAARVGASFLTCLDLHEMIAHSDEEYEELAVELGLDPDRRTALRQKLAERRTTAPLFDTAAWVENVERAYRAMWDIYEAGDKPREIVLD